MKLPGFEMLPVSDFPKESTEAVAKRLVSLLKSKGLKITFAESCTGGLVAKYLTDIPGSSEVFEYGFVTYSDNAKKRILSVDADILSEKSAVSPETAVLMAKGACGVSGANIGVAITGVAGPGPDGEHEEGLIYIALNDGEKAKAVKLSTKTSNQRDYNRQLSAYIALKLAEDHIKSSYKEG